LLCREGLADLAKLDPELQAKLKVVLLAMDSTLEVARGAELLAQVGVDFPAFYLSPREAASLVGTYHAAWDQNPPLNLILTHTGELIEATSMTDAKEILLIVHEHQTFR